MTKQVLLSPSDAQLLYQAVMSYSGPYAAYGYGVCLPEYIRQFVRRIVDIKPGDDARIPVDDPAGVMRYLREGVLPWFVSADSRPYLDLDAWERILTPPAAPKATADVAERAVRLVAVAAVHAGNAMFSDLPVYAKPPTVHRVNDQHKESSIMDALAAPDRVESVQLASAVSGAKAVGDRVLTSARVYVTFTASGASSVRVAVAAVRSLIDQRTYGERAVDAADGETAEKFAARLIACASRAVAAVCADGYHMPYLADTNEGKATWAPKPEFTSPSPESCRLVMDAVTGVATV